MSIDRRFLLRKIFFVGEYRRTRVMKLLLHRRQRNPQVLIFAQQIDPYTLTAGEQTLISRVDDAAIGELHQWLERMDFDVESPSLIYQVLVAV